MVACSADNDVRPFQDTDALSMVSAWNERSWELYGDASWESDSEVRLCIPLGTCLSSAFKDVYLPPSGWRLEVTVWADHHDAHAPAADGWTVAWVAGNVLRRLGQGGGALGVGMGDEYGPLPAPNLTGFAIEVDFYRNETIPLASEPTSPHLAVVRDGDVTGPMAPGAMDLPGQPVDGMPHTLTVEARPLEVDVWWDERWMGTFHHGSDAPDGVLGVTASSGTALTEIVLVDGTLTLLDP